MNKKKTIITGNKKISTTENENLTIVENEKASTMENENYTIAGNEKALITDNEEPFSTKNKKSSIMGKLRYYALFIITVIAGAITLMSLIGALILSQEEAFKGTEEEAFREMLYRKVRSEEAFIDEIIRTETQSEVNHILEEYICNDTNLRIRIVEADSGKEYCSVGKIEAEDYLFEREITSDDKSRRFIITYAIDHTFSSDDNYSKMAEDIRPVLACRTLIQLLIPIGFIVALFCLIRLLCLVGHRKGDEKIYPSFFTKLWLEIPTCAVMLFTYTYGYILISIFDRIIDEYPLREVIIISFCALIIPGAVALWYLTDLVLRIKLGAWYRGTLIYKVYAFCKKFLFRLLSFFADAIRMIPEKPRHFFYIVGIVAGISAVEVFFLIFAYWSGFECDNAMLMIWFMEKVLLVLAILLIEYQYLRIVSTSRELADGNLDYKIDAQKLMRPFREEAMLINRIGEGMTLAVNDRMKSEHLKTELITNVSHDIKTPLTSIINYAGLLGNAELSKEQVDEYAEVLQRQSVRLKKLLEDLVEASKATTGNLEVNFEECKVGVLLNQAAGEYEQRFAEKGLRLVIREPEKELKIRADGRHMWRVFDNLMNNIYKYAQSGTRVILSLHEEEKDVNITFRNSTEFELDISADELMERFVRGDRSRHKEGSGLGLSIAKSLVELQNGNMEIVIDGDLFKVTLTFPKL